MSGSFKQVSQTKILAIGKKKLVCGIHRITRSHLPEFSVSPNTFFKNKVYLEIYYGKASRQAQCLA